MRNLCKLVDDDRSNWDLKIETVLMGYRCSRQGTIKQSPYFMLFQKEMRLPIDSEVLPMCSVNSENELPEMIQALLESRGKLFDDASLNIAVSQREQKKLYDRKHQHSELSVNTKVLLENSRQKQRKGGKMDDRYTGPYIIHRHIGKGVYELRNSQGTILKQKVNVNRLKVYNCGSKDVVQKSVDDIVEQREDFNQEELLKQLHSPSLMRLWRTGASELLYDRDEDDYFDVGSHVFMQSFHC